MKIGISTILFFLINLSFSQESPFNEIKFDKKLQIIHKDTLQNVRERLTGKWKYLGKKINEKISDTISVSYYENKTVTTTIENGIVFETEKDIKRKASYFLELTYSFKDGINNYSLERVEIDGSVIYVTSCQPIAKLIYYEGKIGIHFLGMSGDRFAEINKLTSESLILENGKEYLRLE
jgi:hypothetical protein